MEAAQRETAEQLLDRVLDLNEPLVEQVTRREICELLNISLGRIVDIVGHHPYLEFPKPIGHKNHGLAYSKQEILAWAEKNPLDQIKWRQSEKVEKAPSSFDQALATGFLSGRYDPQERQIDHLQRRLAARSTPRRRQVVRIGNDDFSSHELGARKGRKS